MFLSFLQRAAWALLSGSSIADALNPQVNLGYATYEGTSLSNGVKQFLGIRYAAPPLEENRSRRAVAPLKETGVVMAKEVCIFDCSFPNDIEDTDPDSHGPVCYGVDQILPPSPPLTMSEDCLYIDVYTPRSTETDSCATSDANGLPVMIWIQGGAFVEQFNPNYNGTAIVEASGGNVIVLTFNYRVGPYGFSASDELLQEGNLNLGLHDQRAAMSWVQSHISQFGSDPDRVILFGTSIGGGSVLLQTLAYGEIQAANIGRPPVPGQSNLPLFPYGPVIDDDLFTDRPLSMLKARNFSRHKPLIIGSSGTEGTIFVTQANTTNDIQSFISGHIRSNHLIFVNTHDIPRRDGQHPLLYYRLTQMYGDVRVSCPALDRCSDITLTRLYSRSRRVQAVWGPEYATIYAAVTGLIVTATKDLEIRIRCEQQTRRSSYLFRGDGGGRRLKLQTNATEMEVIPAHELEVCDFCRRMSARTRV
ncbi:Lipase 1 [Talaromyces pinophilus]|nr:Lipase 1 [Talaromyces pinophilus]